MLIESGCALTHSGEDCLIGHKLFVKQLGIQSHIFIAEHHVGFGDPDVDLIVDQRGQDGFAQRLSCLLYTSPSPRD